MRGTTNSVNFSEDLHIAVREDRKIAIPVHAGFDRAARAIYADVNPYLKPGYKTYLTGHSLGGAVAALLSVYLIEDGVDVVRVLTFGQPRFTTADGVRRLGFLPLARSSMRTISFLWCPLGPCWIRYSDPMSKSAPRSSC